MFYSHFARKIFNQIQSNKMFNLWQKDAVDRRILKVD